MFRVAIPLLCPCLSALAQERPPLLGDHVEPSSALAREHVHHARAEGTVVDGSGAPVAGARVFLYGYQPFYWALPIASAVTDAKGAYACDVDGVGRTRLWVASPLHRPFHAVDAALTLCSGRTSQVRAVTLSIPGGEAKPPTVVRGRVAAADGTPIAPAFVRLLHKDALDPTAFVEVAEDGTFAISTGLGTPNAASVFFGNRRIEIEHAAGLEKPRVSGSRWKADLLRELVVQDADFVSLPLTASGAKGVRFLTWRGGRAVPCVGQRAHTIRSNRDEGSANVVATASGHVPRSGSVPIEEFDFAGDVPRTLRVVDDQGAPIAGAKVDLCEEGARFEEQTMETVRTDAEGRIRLLAEKDATCVVYAYAERHDPTRGLWCDGEELRLVLAKHTSRLALDVRDEIISVFVRRAGLFDPAAILYPAAGKLEIELAPGDYEVTCYGKAKPPVISAERVAIKAGAEVKLPQSADERPTVRMRVPASVAGAAEWWAFATRETRGGMITKWTVHTQRGGPMPRRALAAEVEEVANAEGADREFLVRLPISGRHTLVLGADKEPRRFFREVLVELGRHYAIDLPSASVAVRGSVASYPELWETGMNHGIAGPRLCVEPEKETAFGLFVPLPEPAEFSVNVPAPAHYVLHHHLYKTSILRSSEGTSGGRPIEVGDAALDLGTLERGQGSELEVRVRGAGENLLDGTLSVRDRMFEAWSHDLAQNTTLEGALDAIPSPPSARLRDGAARLERIRAGRLTFVLDLDDGRRVYFTRTVDPSRRLDVELPGVRR